MPDEKTLSDSDIVRLWHDPSFTGSFRGIKTFQTLLKTDLNYNISENRLTTVLKTDSLFLIHQRPKRNFDRRKYSVHFYGQLVQIDLAYMFPDEKTNKKYFLLAIDVFSSKIFTESLQGKSSDEVTEAMRKIFSDFKQPIYEIQADRGKEFIGKSFKRLLKEKNTFIRLKRGKNKASVAEYGILLVKKKLYLLLRSQMSHEWSFYLQKVTDSLNNTPLKRLGWLTPNTIKNEASSVFVRNAKKESGIETYENPTFEQQKQNQASYNGDLKIGDYVYLDFDEKLFDKSFDVSVKYFRKHSNSCWPNFSVIIS